MGEDTGEMTGGLAVEASFVFSWDPLTNYHKGGSFKRKVFCVFVFRFLVSLCVHVFVLKPVLEI